MMTLPSVVLFRAMDSSCEISALCQCNNTTFKAISVKLIKGDTLYIYSSPAITCDNSCLLWLCQSLMGSVRVSRCVSYPACYLKHVL